LGLAGEADDDRATFLKVHGHGFTAWKFVEGPCLFGWCDVPGTGGFRNF
jgi:hypothetical protein